MPLDLATILRLDPSLLGDLSNYGGAYDPASNLPPELQAAAAAGPAGPLAPAPIQPSGGAGPLPSQPLAPQDPRMLGAAGPTGSIDPSQYVAPRPDAPWWRNFLGNMMANGGADQASVVDFKDPTYRQRVAQMKGAQAKQLFPNDPVGQALWMQNDPDLKKAMAKNEEIRGDAPDNTISRNGSPVFTTAPAPKQGVDGGYGWTWDQKKGFVWGPQRGPSYEDVTKAKDATIKGREVDDKIAKTTEGEQIGAIIEKVRGGATPTPAEQVILDAYLEHLKHPNLFAPGATITPGGVSPGGGGGGGGGGGAAGGGSAADAKLYDPPTGFKATPGVSTYKMQGGDGKMRIYRYVNGKLQLQGLAKGAQ